MDWNNIVPEEARVLAPESFLEDLVSLDVRTQFEGR
jgi:hypothetical protein